MTTGYDGPSGQPHIMTQPPGNNSSDAGSGVAQGVADDATAVVNGLLQKGGVVLLVASVVALAALMEGS